MVPKPMPAAALLVLYGVATAQALCQAEARSQEPEARSQEQSADRNRLVGAWRLVSVEATAGDKVTTPLGYQPRGLLVLTPSGHWSAQLMADNHASAGRGGDGTQPADPRLTYRAHFGTYTVNESARSLVLHREGDLDVAGIGFDTLRFYAFEGNRIVLTLPTETRHGVDVVTRVVWERIGR